MRQQRALVTLQKEFLVTLRRTAAATQKEVRKMALQGQKLASNPQVQVRCKRLARDITTLAPVLERRTDERREASERAAHKRRKLAANGGGSNGGGGGADANGATGGEAEEAAEAARLLAECCAEGAVRTVRVAPTAAQARLVTHLASAFCAMPPLPPPSAAGGGGTAAAPTKEHAAMLRQLSALKSIQSAGELPSTAAASSLVLSAPHLAHGGGGAGATAAPTPTAPGAAVAARASGGVGARSTLFSCGRGGGTVAGSVAPLDGLLEVRVPLLVCGAACAGRGREAAAGGDGDATDEGGGAGGSGSSGEARPMGISPCSATLDAMHAEVRWAMEASVSSPRLAAFLAAVAANPLAQTLSELAGHGGEGEGEGQGEAAMAEGAAAGGEGGLYRRIHPRGYPRGVRPWERHAVGMGGARRRRRRPPPSP